MLEMSKGQVATDAAAIDLRMMETSCPYALGDAANCCAIVRDQVVKDLP